MLCAAMASSVLWVDELKKLVVRRWRPMPMKPGFLPRSIASSR
jgi:hypothetical protein